ncbi:MAG: peroxide stress protein YaaA [Idiomarina sp.]|nr:peroxide stress protein YaaA [Idiomarina sp.]
MLFVVSPAKNLDYDTPAPVDKATQPQFKEAIAELVSVCQKLSPQQLGSLMSISDKLAALNAARFTSFEAEFNEQNSKQAVFAFNGDVYTGLDAASLPASTWDYGQRHMRILSGLYGLLRPLDLMQPYRLEMGTKLANPQGKDLYSYWDGTITNGLNEALAAADTDVLVNLASNEYFKSVQTKQLKAKVVTPVFKDTKNGQLKVISFYAKKARGLMARYILEKQPNSVEELKSFNAAGYEFDASLSKENELVFKRAEQ